MSGVFCRGQCEGKGLVDVTDECERVPVFLRTLSLSLKYIRQVAGMSCMRSRCSICEP